MNEIQWGLLALAAIIVFWMVGAYNRLLSLRNAIAQAAGQMDEPLRRRDELIAGLLTLLRPMAEHVSLQTLQGVDEAGSALVAAANALKAKPLSAEAPSRLAVAEVGLQAGLSTLLQLVENTQALRLSPGMLERLAGISEAERRMRFGRQLYNEAVKTYNAALTEWPTRLLRRAFGLDEASTI